MCRCVGQYQVAHKKTIAHMSHSLERWKTWSASKLPGRAVNRFVRGWAVPRLSLSIEVHRTACIVTHPPGGEGANDALCNPATSGSQSLASHGSLPEPSRNLLVGQRAAAGDSLHTRRVLDRAIRRLAASLRSRALR